MAITLYYGSGSPYAWRAQFALEHKALPYELKVLSFAAGDTRKPEFLALNPRHRVPVLVEDDFVLYESSAIVEYLDEAYPGRGAPLFPGDARTRAIIRRMICEVDEDFDEALDPLTTQAFAKSPRNETPKPSPIAQGVGRGAGAVHPGDARRLSCRAAVGGRLRALYFARFSVADGDQAAGSGR